MRWPHVVGVLVFGLVVTAVLLRTYGDVDARVDEVSAATMASTFHRGPPPCLRYASDQLEPLALYEDSARRLAALELDSDTVGKALGHFLLQSRLREEAAHEKESVDEYLEQLSAGQHGLARVTFWLQRNGLRERLVKILSQSSGRLGELEFEGEETWRKLTPSQRDGLEGLANERPLHLHVNGLRHVLPLLSRQTTVRRVHRAARWLSEHPGQRLPETLDDWGAPLKVEAVDGGALVRSAGADDAGPEDDVVERVPALPPPCGPIEGLQVVVSRAAAREAGRSDAPHRVPVMRKGGLEVQVPKGSALERLGLCHHDIIHSVNGIALDKPERALEISEQLKGSKFEVRLERSGVVATVSVEVED